MKFTFDGLLVGGELPERTVFFDSTCNLCTESVSFIRRQSRINFEFVPLHVSEFRDEKAASLIFLEKGRYYRRSDAVLKIARHLKWPFWLMHFFIIVPRFFRDWVYNIIARHRYKWFGRCETCQIHS